MVEIFCHSGPMSFIEYESVEYATRALSDLYGHTLGGLVKGGIRLSYSKNPLVSLLHILRDQSTDDCEHRASAQIAFRNRMVVDLSRLA